MRRYVIIHPRTFGLRHDALVLAQALRSLDATSDVLEWEFPLGGKPASQPKGLQDLPLAIVEMLPFRAVFFLEHLRPIDLVWSPGFTQKIVFVPNMEWLSRADTAILEKRKIDAVFLKNVFSLECADAVPSLSRIAHRPVTGWSSIDIGGRPPAHDEKDYGRFLHVRGLSRQKQTDLVIRTWFNNPGFPPMDVVCSIPDGLSLPAPAKVGRNLNVLIGDMPTADLRRLQRRCGGHVAPSAAEAFGHSLNEARAAAAVLITTDAPPMNDLVEDGVTGFLVPARPENVRDFGPSRAYFVTEKDLTATVRRAMRLSPDEAREMGARARAAFLADRAAFHSRLAAALTALFQTEKAKLRQA